MAVDILMEQQVSQAGGTLGGLTAIAIETAHNTTGMERAFLMKKMRVCYSAEGLEVSDNVMLLLSRGNISVTELAAALAVDDNVEDDYQLAQATIRRCVDLVMVPSMGGQTGTHSLAYTWNVDLPRKGIPFEEGEGWFLAIFNPSTSAWVTGSIHNVTSKIWGVYL